MNPYFVLNNAAVIFQECIKLTADSPVRLAETIILNITIQQWYQADRFAESVYRVAEYNKIVFSKGGSRGVTLFCLTNLVTDGFVNSHKKKKGEIKWKDIFLQKMDERAQVWFPS